MQNLTQSQQDLHGRGTATSHDYARRERSPWRPHVERSQLIAIGAFVLLFLLVLVKWVIEGGQ